MTPLDLDKEQKYSIVGAPKAGTSSLAEYMRQNYYDVTEDELHFFDSDYASKLSLRVPIIITRDPVERAWSDYNFFKDWHDTHEKACEWSKYEKYMKLYPHAKVFKLEELQKLDGFPCHNQNPNKPELTEEIRRDIRRVLLKR